MSSPNLSSAPKGAADLISTLPALANDGEPVWLAQARNAAKARAEADGLPTRRHENWRFTDLKALREIAFTIAPANDALSADAANGLASVPVLAGADRLVFVNGRFSAEASTIGRLPDGVFLGRFADWAKSGGEMIEDRRPGADATLRALNTAYFTDGFALDIPAGVSLERPVQLVYWAAGASEAPASETSASETPASETPAAVTLKGVVRLGAGAKAVVLEAHAGEGSAWVNSALDVVLGEGAELGHYKVQNEDRRSLHTGDLAVEIGAKAEYDGFTLLLGAAQSRQDVRTRLAGPHGFCGVSGAYLLDGRQEGAIATTIRHDAPNCNTKEVIKGCLGGRSHGVFLGRIEVAQVAQKTDAYQLNKTILLGDRAVMDAKPELEIFADDVKCAHGATVGDLDEEALFYLRSRGIDAETARGMLIEAFVVDAVDLVRHEGARAYLKDAIVARLRAQKGETA